MNIAKLQDIKLTHRNPLHSYTLTMRKTEREIKETIPFTIATKRIKYLGFTFMHWRMKWQPNPVFLPGQSQGWGSLVGFSI